MATTWSDSDNEEDKEDFSADEDHVANLIAFTTSHFNDEAKGNNALNLDLEAEVRDDVARSDEERAI